MVNWDKSDPKGSEIINKGALRIREMRQALSQALQEEHYLVEVSGDLVAYHKFPYSSSTPGYTGRWRYNPTTTRIERYDGSAWVGLTPPADLMVAGTKTFFFQSAAPTGWVQDTSYNDNLLRVVSSGAISSGGAWGAATNNSTPTHTHPLESSTVSLAHAFSVYGKAAGSTTLNLVTAIGDHSSTHGHTSLDVTGGAAHSHTVTAAWRPAYIDVIAATKS